MATKAQTEQLNIEEQLARIAKMRRDDEKASVDIQKTGVDIQKVSVEIQKLTQDIKLATPQMFFQGAVATAALIGATAAIAKVFFP
jgi:hypothetical protein